MQTCLPAARYNKACRDLYERIIAKGKSKKLALIAVCNNLLKQAIAIAKSGKQTIAIAKYGLIHDSEDKKQVKN